MSELLFRSALWMFVHHGLATHFHQGPAQLVATLDGGGAVAYLEQTWAWALKAAGSRTPERPPLSYGIDRPRPGLAIVWMRVKAVSTTGEPWHIRLIVRDADPGMSNGYSRMFMLAHSEYASELAGRPQALTCESLVGRGHRNWGMTLAADDEQGFDQFVIDTLRSNPQPAAELTPPK